MQITIKNLKGQIFPLEVEANQTILDIKNKIKQLKGFQIESQKIVFKGKATNNTDQIGGLGIKQADFLVIMTMVKKPDPKKEQTKPSVEKPMQAEKPNQQKKQEKKQEKPSNAELQQKIAYLSTMGFPRDQCELALKAAFNDSERAVQYLVNGIPTNLTDPNSGPTGEIGEQLLEGLLMNPQFAQIRQMIRNDPSSLQPILQQISQTSPQLYNLISQHPEAFQRLILESGDLEGEDEELGEGQIPQGPPGSIVVTQAEQQAINRLMALGFSKIDAAQAYLACDKNQEMAANLLFDRLANGDIDQGMDDEPPQGDEDDDNLFN